MISKQLSQPLMPIVAAGLIVLSLGMPWIFLQGTDSSFIPGWFLPGTCVTVYDLDGWASSDCTPGTVAPGILLPGTRGTTGAGMEHSGRFGLAWGLLMTIIGLQTGRRHLLTWGGLGLGLVTGLSTGGGGVTSGVLLAWAASALLIISGTDGALRPRLTALVERFGG